ncbi:MAG TPA: carbohydrate kinase [Anaerolineaceae bacterium]|nr:carbohydrate kinase [Anaerolineaceae bacterium]
MIGNSREEIRVAAIGDNCIDLYPRLKRQYCTGNAVDFAVNVQKLGLQTSLISVTGDDENGTLMVETLQALGVDLSHFKVKQGQTAITYMDMTENNDRIHGDYVEGVLENIIFTEDDIVFAAQQDLVHTAFWGKAHPYLAELHTLGARISFDYANKTRDPLVADTLPFVDYAFFSFSEHTCEVEQYLENAVEKGPRIAVATFGAKGSLAYDGTAYHEFGIFPASVVNTVGAGDSFIAGFMVGILTGLEIPACLEKGAQVAAQVVEVFEPWINY